jgi:HlyD family secretion protein
LKKWFALPLLLLLALAAWVWHRKSQPPVVPFAKVKRETLVSTLPTNGKVEPIEWQTVRTEAAGLVERVPVQEGLMVRAGAVLAQLSQTGLQAELTAAEARVALARAQLATIEAGGKSAELVEISNQLARARLNREAAIREHNALKRLAEKQAATPLEVQAAYGKVREAELEIDGLEKRRAALIGKTDKSVAEANLRDAEAAVQLARTRIAQTIIHSPIAGVAYGLKVRPGAYVQTGDEVTNVGKIDRVRVRVYVDEPELGRVSVGQPVTITWSALPGKQWNGTVELGATGIVALGTRQVGEVLCTIDNPGHELKPGTNIDAEIRTSVVQGALTIPREALRREMGGVVGVYTLEGDPLRWRKVQTGVSSATRVAVTEGLKEGDPVALPTDQPLKDGERVQPVYR